jgi:hypothetical protein
MGLTVIPGDTHDDVVTFAALAPAGRVWPQDAWLASLGHQRSVTDGDG